MDGNYDGEVRDIPYDEAQAALDAEAERLLDEAREQLEVNYEKKGDGWQNETPRFHFWKGIDELYSATHRAKESDITLMERRIADGLNHLLMASILAYEDYDADALLDGEQVRVLTIYRGGAAYAVEYLSGPEKGRRTTVDGADLDPLDPEDEE